MTSSSVLWQVNSVPRCSFCLITDCTILKNWVRHLNIKQKISDRDPVSGHLMGHQAWCVIWYIYIWCRASNSHACRPKNRLCAHILGCSSRCSWILDQLSASWSQRVPGRSQLHGLKVRADGGTVARPRAQLRATSAAASRLDCCCWWPCAGPGEPGTESRATRRQGRAPPGPPSPTNLASGHLLVFKEHYHPTTKNPFLMQSPWNSFNAPIFTTAKTECHVWNSLRDNLWLLCLLFFAMKCVPMRWSSGDVCLIHGCWSDSSIKTFWHKMYVGQNFYSVNASEWMFDWVSE